MERRQEESAKGEWKEMPSTSEVLDWNTAIQNLFDTVLTAAPVSIDPYVVASRHETVFEGSQVKGARRRRCRDAQGGGREDLLCVDAHHKALDKEASRDRGRGARADPRQALQERSDA